MKRSLFLAFTFLSATAFAKPEQPNILFIVGDDYGWGDAGWHGSRAETPNMDRLVREGVELDRHYVQPLCTPTRAALLSGRYPSRFGPQVLAPSNLRSFPPGTETLASALKSVGYDTALSGKWHLGSEPQWGPNHYGFNRSYGSLTGAVDPWLHTYRQGPFLHRWHRDEQLVDEEGNATELVTQEALKTINAKKEPWFLYLPFQAVHIPIDAPEEYKKHFAEKKYYNDPVKDESYNRYLAFIYQMDTKIGQLVAALDATGQRERTMIVFTGDNGSLMQGGNAYVSNVAPNPVLGSNLPLRGQKGQLYEGGIRVPAWVNWKGKLAPAKVSLPIHAVDWTPTLTKLAGYTPSRDLHWDGQDIWPALTGDNKATTSHTIYWPFINGDALRDGDWKLIEWHSRPVVPGGDADDKPAGAAPEAKGKRAKGESKAPELYNVTADPSEEKDLAAAEPERMAKMHAMMEQMRAGDLHELPADLANLPKK